MSADPVQPEPGEDQQKNKTIGQVLTALEPQFPGISASKIRFLEEKGLVSPQRTNTGYRKYSEQDIQRLRYVLELQRDHYLPLKVIRERLAEMDAAGSLEERPGEAAPSTGTEPAQASAAPPASRTFTLRELGQEAGVDMPLLRELMRYGLLVEGKEAYDEYDLAVTRVSDQLTAHGLHPRHLRSFRTNADREIELVKTAVGPLALRKDEGSQTRAAELAAEIAQLLLRLHMGLVAGSMPTYD